jgi:hypothetical protein
VSHEISTIHSASFNPHKNVGGFALSSFYSFLVSMETLEVGVIPSAFNPLFLYRLSPLAFTTISCRASLGPSSKFFLIVISPFKNYSSLQYTGCQREI